MNSFLTTTSTKNDLEGTSFLSSLDMDPQGNSTTTVPGASESPAGGKSNMSLPVVGTESLFAALASPPASGAQTPVVGGTGEGKREVFQDFKRLMTFGLRRDSGVKY
jgi:hypothetical protein